MKNLSLIAAVAGNRAIGKDNDLLCHLPNDLKHFKALTVDHTIIMGRHTFESLPAGPLPRRKNVVLSSRPESLPSTVSAFSSLSEALAEERGEDELFIIGGATLYNQSITDAGRLYITEIHHDFPDADTFFPEINWAEWNIEFEEYRQADADNPYDCRFLILQRKA